MRNEKEMMNLIVGYAKKDSRVLAAYLKGSRTNPLVPKDIYRDYDVMYVVKETQSFMMDTAWMETFGKVILKQEQDCDFGYGDQFGLRNHFEQLYSWLLLFEDGNRIDIGVETVSHMQQSCQNNKLFLPLLDKTGCLPQLPSPSDEDFYVKQPSEQQFLGCCNTFFWNLCDVIKGIAREEIPFAMTTYMTLSHNMLEQMLNWYIGCHTSFSVSCGKRNKYFRKYLSERMYLQFLQTYTDGHVQNMWKAIENCCILFHDAAVFVANNLGYQYPQNDENGFFHYKNIIKSSIKHNKETGRIR